jgi:hypothetical protein
MELRGIILLVVVAGLCHASGAVAVQKSTPIVVYNQSAQFCAPGLLLLSIVRSYLTAGPWY